MTAVAIVAFLYGRRYVAFGWLWYVGTLVPVIGFVQVGEQAMADRYTYIPYIGLFVAIVWGIADLLENFAFLRKLPPALAVAMVVILGSCMSWTNYQIQTWRDVQTHLLHALDVEPDNWNMLNNYGVWLWKEARERDIEAAKAEAKGDREARGGGRATWKRRRHVTRRPWRQRRHATRRPWSSKTTPSRSGSTASPHAQAATDIHSDLGYAYSRRPRPRQGRVRI